MHYIITNEAIYQVTYCKTTSFLFIEITCILSFYAKYHTFCIFSRFFEILLIFAKIAQKYVKFAKNSEK
jgi:hypothetical protein